MRMQSFSIDLEFISLVYTIRGDQVSFTVVPLNKKNQLIETKLFKTSTSQYFYVDSMVQIASRGDSSRRNFSRGQTLFNSDSAFNLRYLKQEKIEHKDGVEVRTYFQSEQYKVTHVVETKKSYKAFTIHNEIENIGNDVYLDRIDSFTLNTITPFNEENNPDNLLVHTLDSYWSMEARKHTDKLSRYDFRDSWSKLGIKMFKISSLGMMPARGHHPFMAVEDTDNNVTWAAQLINPDSWQIELVHNYGSVSMTGGHADYLTGRWEKLLKHGEKFITNKTIISVVNGGLDEACKEITRFHDFLYSAPDQEYDLPIIYNEYLSSWGHPTLESVKDELKIASSLGCKEFVIDAGWFTVEDEQGEGRLGDWNVNLKKFPGDLKAYESYAKKLNFHTCGIWYEFEAVTINSDVYKNHPEYLATLYGKIIQVDNRCFLDFNKPEVIEYLKEKVIKNIVNNNMNYIKLDYNENLGYEMDGPSDNKAENVRTHALKVQEFINEIKKNKPDLVFETCSSGGMRHEPSFDYIGSMVSFSDAHEILGGVAISMDMHRIMQPRIMQIWASLLPIHELDQAYVILAKGMLGRLCYSGKILDVSKNTYNLALEATQFYKKLVPIIRDGDTTLIDTDEINDVNNPKGVCRLVRKSRSGDSLIFYAFNLYSNKNSIEISVPDEYELVDQFTNLNIHNNQIIIGDNKLGAFVGLFRRKNND